MQPKERKDRKGKLRMDLVALIPISALLALTYSVDQ
jgi:hypothetical protein